jgi:hypothetical protein
MRLYFSLLLSLESSTLPCPEDRLIIHYFVSFRYGYVTDFVAHYTGKHKLSGRKSGQNIAKFAV